jgi:hypothetical protein
MPRVSAERQAEQEAKRAEERRRTYVRFVCPDCKTIVAVYLLPDESRRRTCRSIYGPWIPGRKQEFLPTGTLCGQVLNVEADETYRHSVSAKEE